MTKRKPENSNPYSAPAPVASESEPTLNSNSGEWIHRLWRAFFAASVGAMASVIVAAFCTEVDILEVHGVFLISSFLLTLIGVYLVIRRAKLWAIAVVFGLTTLVLLVDNSPSYGEASDIMGYQSLGVFFACALFCEDTERLFGASKNLGGNNE